MTAHALAPSPLDLRVGVPDQFSRWYPNQEDALDFALRAPGRFRGVALPTGTGKSLAAWMCARLLNEATTGHRAVILTHRKGLAEQYRAVFGRGVVEVRGWRNYRTKWEYRAALGAAQQAPIVVTTYAYWLAATNHGQGLGPGIDTIICDEAHAVLDELSSFLSCDLDQEQLTEWGLEWPDQLTEDPRDWAVWAKAIALPHLDRIHPDPNDEDMTERLAFLKARLGRVAAMRGKWTARVGRRRVYLAKVWPGDEAERYLYHGAEHVVFLSATLRPKTLDLVGARGASFAEWDHPYPWEIRPVYYIPTIRATPEKRATKVDWENWVYRIDQLVDRWPQELGLVHTVSYPRAKMFMERSVHHDILSTHSTKTTERTVEWFRGTQGPHVLVSPSLIAGWDLPEVTWQVLGKVPWPPSGDALIEARTTDDPDYVLYDIGQKVVQMAGRIVRGPAREDYGVTYIIDDSWRWTGPKLQSMGLLARWFYVEKRNVIPRD